MSKVVDYSSRGPAEGEGREKIIDYIPPQRMNVREVINKNIIIRDVEFRPSRRGEFAVLYAEIEGRGEEVELYTFAARVIEALKHLKPTLNKGIKVRARVCVEEKRNQLYLCEPLKYTPKP
jgi:hypothetical protein